MKILLVVSITALLIVSSKAQEDVSQEILTRKAISLAGPLAMSCGNAKIGQDLTAQNSCVRNNLDEEAFLCELRLQGFDSNSGVGLVRAEERADVRIVFRLDGVCSD